MDDPDFLFHKNDLFNVAICKKCQFGVISSRIEHHIHAKHENETKESAKHIAKIVSTWNVRNDRRITHSNNAIDQQEHLRLYKEAFRCKQCNYFSHDVYNMRAHCRDRHKWNPYESKNGRLKNIGPWREHVHCQKIFPVRFGQFFEVKANAINEDLVQQAAALDPDFLFHKNDLFNAAICKKCQYGVFSTRIARHISERHEEETKESARNIVEIVSAWNVRNDGNIDHPTGVIDQQEHIALYRDGLACRKCGYICRDMPYMRRHCKDKHGWISSNDKKSHNGPLIQWRENVLCQRIFYSSCPYVEVRQKVDPELPQSNAPTDENAMELEIQEDSDDLAQKVWDSTISTLTKAYRLGIHLREQSLLLNLNETEDRFVTEEHTFEQFTTCFASLMVFFVRARNVRFTSRQLADWNNYKRLVKDYQQDDKEDISDVEEACTRFCISLLDDQTTRNSETTLVKAMTCNGEPEFTVLLGWLKGARWMVLNFAFLEIDRIKEVYPDVGTTRPQELLEIFTERCVRPATAMRWLLDQIETIGATCG